VNAILNEIEARVIGALIEKQVTTPEYYPLTLNALTHACNQTSNRDPVVAYDDKTVAHALETLREKNLAYVFYGSESRVPKYKQMLADIYHLTEPERAVLCVLLLRGAQTVGELRGRTNRLYDFNDLAEVEAALESLMTREDEPPLVVRLPRQSGQKEARYAHLLAGDVVVEEEDAQAPRAERAVRPPKVDNEKLAELTAQVEELRRELAELRQQFDSFKKQFE
jgi:uncharacterized protein YceH (UPF0502 family)